MEVVHTFFMQETNVGEQQGLYSPENVRTILGQDQLHNFLYINLRSLLNVLSYNLVANEALVQLHELRC